MRYREIASGLRVPVSGEEQELLDNSENGVIAKADLDERGQELARHLVSRGVLNQYRQNNHIFYHISSVNDIWRDRDG